MSAPDVTVNVPVFDKQGGGERVVGSGGKISVQSGGVLNIETGGALQFNGSDQAAALAAGVAGTAAGFKIARGVAGVTGTATVVTGLTTVVACGCTSQDDPDGTNLAMVSATIGDQSGAPAAGSIILKAWKITAANNAALIAATVAKNLNWWAIGT